MLGVAGSGVCCICMNWQVPLLQCHKPGCHAALRVTYVDMYVANHILLAYKASHQVFQLQPVETESEKPNKNGVASH